MVRGRIRPEGRAALFLVVLVICSPHDVGASNWSRLYAPIDMAQLEEVVLTDDCGLVAAGLAVDVAENDRDAWVLKLDARGEVEWARAYGGPAWDDRVSIDQCADGGYQLAAETMSFGAGAADLWVLKLDSNCLVVWQKTYGEALSEGTPFVRATPGGGALLAGTNKVSGRGDDIWLLKLDSEGRVEWQRAYGGRGTDCAGALELTADGGIVIAGPTSSFGEGDWDIWVLKLDGSGAIEWEKAYGESNSEWAHGILQTSDGGYIVVGSREVTGPNIFCQVLKLDSRGEIEWEKEVRGGEYGVAWAVAEAADGGYLVTAMRSSFSPQVGWLFKLDASGNLEWEKTYGGLGFDDLFDVLATPEGGFVAVGGTSTFSVDRGDAWVLKLNGEGRVDGTCGFIRESRSTITDTSLTVQDTEAVVLETTVVGIDTQARVRDTPVTVTEQCGDGGCVYLACEFIEAEPEVVCEGDSQTFTAGRLCGEGPVSVEWDFDGDTLPDAAGNPVEVALPPGVWSVRATATDSCPDPGPQSCFVEKEVEVLPSSPPGEVSDIKGGEPPLLVNPSATRLVVEKVPEAVAYNVYADAIGSWYEPTAAKGAVCGIAEWTDNGNGTLTLDYVLPLNSWIVVTASTPCAEGPAGCGTAATERTTLDTWQLCGPAP